MLFSCAGDLLELHSFPTRRSSDLLGEVVGSQMRGLAVTTTDRLPLGREVLEDDADALATERRAAGTLHPDDDRPGELGRQHRVLPEGLLGAAPTAVAQHVQGRDQREMDPAGGELGGPRARGPLERRGIPAAPAAKIGRASCRERVYVYAA